MNELTAIQKATLNIIKQLHIETLYPPTIRDIASLTGISTKAVQDRVNGLRAKGYMAHDSKLIPKGVKVIIND